MNIHFPNPFRGSGSRRQGDDIVRLQAVIDGQDAVYGRLLAAVQRQCDANAERADLLQNALAGAIRCTCPIGKHSVFWVYDERFTACPWCLVDAERSARRTGVPVISRAPERAPVAMPRVLPLHQRPSGGISVPAMKDVPGFRVTAATTAETVADNTLASLAAADEDPKFLTGLGLSIAATTEPDTVTLPVARTLGPEVTAAMPAVDDPSAAVHLQPAADTVPPKPRQPPLPPAHLVEQQLVTRKPKLPGDPLASDDLKTVAPATGVPGTGGWQSVQLTR